MTREDLIHLVNRIIRVDVPTEAEHDALIDLFEASVSRSEGTDLIYCPERTDARDLLRGGQELTAEEIVDIALAYKPIQLPPAP